MLASLPSFFLQARPPQTALLKQTRTIPIIFGNLADPVGSGFVESLRDRSELETAITVQAREPNGGTPGDARWVHVCLLGRGYRARRPLPNFQRPISSADSRSKAVSSPMQMTS